MNERDSQPAASNAEQSLLGQQAMELVEQLQQQLNSLRDQLAWSNRLSQLGMLTASLAHETNNLLAPIRSYAQLAKANPDDDRLNQCALDAAIAGTAKLAKLVESVVNLASPGPGEGRASCKVDEVVQDAIACMLPILKQHGVHTTSQVPPAFAAIDALALEQVLVNLISNATHAMSGTRGKRQILIESKQGQDTLTLRVTDTGPGVPTQLRDHAFEPFVSERAGGPKQSKQQDSSTAEPENPEQSKGSGLGLSICKQLVESAGGWITLDPQESQGASFSITLLNGK